MNKEHLRKYAELIVKSGLNLHKGDNLLINFNKWGLELAETISELAYEAGIGDVILAFNSEKVTRSFFEKAEDVEYFPEFKKEYLEKAVENNYNRLSIVAENPALLKGIDPEKIQKVQKARGKALKKVMEATMSNKVKWCVVAVPNAEWATMVFPELSEEEAMDKLWENIFKATRADLEDPVKAWKEHDERLKRVQNFLNESSFEKLLYKGPGTDLEVYLVNGHKWVGGSGPSQSGDIFFANIPTEEIFSMPHKYKVNGTLKATLPLALHGNLVKDFNFTFKDGKVVDFDAKEGKEVLEKLLSTDEGAKRLGEVALVPHNSPISNTGILFQNTLFDENASCHFAVGAAYSENVANGDKLSDEEKDSIGMNNSLTHVDFMVGSKDIVITGVKKDGSQTVIIKDGEWQI